MLQYSDQELESAYQDLSSGRVKPNQLNDDALNQINNYISKRQMPDVAKRNAPASYFNGPASQLKSGGNAIQQLQNESEYRSKTFKPQSLPTSKPKENAMLNYAPYAPEAANKTYESMYKDYQKSLADNTIYSGSAPKQANVNPNAPKLSPEEIQQRLYQINQQKQYEQLTREAEQKRQDNKSKGFLTNFEGRFGSALRAASLGGMYPIAKDGSGFDLNQLPKNVQEQILGQQYDTGSNVLNTTADIIGNLTSFGTPLGGANALSYANDITNLTKQLPYATGALGRISGKVANQLAKSPKFVRTGLEQVPAGAFIGGVDIPLRNDISPINNPKEYAKSVAENVALGAGLGAGASITASALKKIYNKLFAPKVEVLPPEAQLTLPPGQRPIGLPEGTTPRTTATANENVFPAYSKNVKKVKTDETIYSENPFIPSKGKVKNPVKELQQIYSKKLEDFRDYVLQKHGGQPNNHEVLLNDWSEFADKYDPDIETAFDWAYNPAVKSNKERIVNAFGSIKNAKGAILRGRDYLQSREAAGVSSFVNKRPKPFINQSIDNLPTKEEPIPTQQPNEQATVTVPSISNFVPPVKEQPVPKVDQERALFDNKVKRFFGRDVNTSNLTTNELYDLSSQIDQQTSGLKNVKASSNPAISEGKFDPYNITYTTKNPQANDIYNDMNRIDDELSKLTFQMEQEVKMLIPLLKKEIGNKPSIVTEYDKVDGLVLPTGGGVRVSNNPEWYQQWAKKNGYRTPNKQDFENIARSIVFDGKYYGGGESFQTKKALEEVKIELQSELRKIKNEEVKNPLDDVRKVEQSKKSINQVISENTKRTDQVISAQEQQLGFIPSSNRSRSNINMKEVRSSDPLVEAALNATKTFRQTLIDNVIEKLKAPIEFSKTFYNEYLNYRHELKSMPKLQNDFRKAEGMPSDARELTLKSLDSILGSLRDKPEFEVFRRMIILKDFEQELLSERTVSNNLTLRNVQNEIDSLMDFVQKSPSIQTAIANHELLMKSIGEDLVARGKLSADSIKDNYYPHRVLDYVQSIENSIAKQNGLKEIKSPNRFYTKQRQGSGKLIESDYIDVMNNTLYKVYLDNMIDDFVNKIVSENNSFSKLKDLPEPPKLSRDGQSVTLADGNKYNLWFFNGESYLLDSRIYNNIKDFKGKTSTSPILNAGQAFTSWWKRLTLDFAGFVFHWNNFLGDTLALYRDDPMAFSKLPQATKMLLSKNNKLNSVDQNILRLAEKQRIFQSGITEGILGELFPKQSIQSKFIPAQQKLLYWANPFNILENVSNVRESIPRLAKFLKDVERIQKGEMIQSKVIDVQKLLDEKFKAIDIAGKVSREGFIDYGSVSKHAQSELRGFWIPFFTFYFNNLKNWTKYVVKHPVDFGVKFGLPFGALMLWNNTGDRREVEKQLPDYIRDVPHFITGYLNDEGKPYVMTFNTPMNAAEQIVALNKVPNRLVKLFESYQTYDNNKFFDEVKKEGMDQLKDTIAGPSKSLTTLLNPLPRSIVETIANKQALTGSDVVPSRLVGTDEENQLKTKYILGQLFTPFGTIERFKQNELSPDDSVLKGIANQFTPSLKTFGKFVDLPRQNRNQVYEDLSQERDMEKQLKLNVEEAFKKYKLDNDLESYLSIQKQSKLTREQIKNIERSPRVNIDIIKQKLKQTNDPNERNQLNAELNSWYDRMERSAFDSLSLPKRIEIKKEGNQ